MLKALFLDMDETLCDTTGANIAAQQLLASKLEKDFHGSIDGAEFAHAFLKGIYKIWSAEEREKYQPFREQHGEHAYRQYFTRELLQARGINIEAEYATNLHKGFEVNRMAAFDFFPAIKAFLLDARSRFTLVVITNGPEFSQIPKLNAVQMENYVDHILIGGQEPEEKPARSIFEKAMRLAECSAQEAVHIGDSLNADIAGANNVGMESVWIRHGQALGAETDPRPTHTLESPNDIPALVQNLWW